MIRTMTLTLLLAALYTATAQQLPTMKDWFLPIGAWDQSPELYVVERGTGPDTVIMLHGGWGADYQGLVDATEGLEHDFHFVYYDQRGSLHSPFPDSLITFDDHINDVELLREALGLQQINLVGHSMGAVLASAYATRYPDRISKLTLITPAHLKNPLKEERKVSSRQFEAQSAFMEREAVSAEIERLALNDSELEAKENTALFRIRFASRMLYDVTKWNQLTGGRSLYHGHVYTLTANTYPSDGWNFIQSLATYDFPLAYLAASHDFLDFGNGLAQQWSEELERATLHIIPEAGHIPWIDQPVLFREALREAIRVD